MSRTVRSILMVAMGVTALAPPVAHAADSRPAVRVSDVRKTEPGSGASRARFFLRLDRAARVPMYVRYATVAGTATAGADYRSRTGRITFRPGETRRFVDVRILADTPDERTERFTLRLSAARDRPAASRPRLKDATGRGTIVDRDPPPTIAVYGVSGPESSPSLRFRVRLSRATYRAVTVNFATKTGTATAQDFVSRSGRLSIPSGSREGFIDIDLRNDTIVEPGERFAIELTGPTGGRLTKPSANATIVDDDSQRAVSISDVTVSETTGTALLEVTVSSAGGAVKVSYATHSGTATQNVDFTQTVGDVTIPAGATVARITVPITIDYLDEVTEFFTVRLVEPVGAAIADDSATVTILDTDRPPVVNVTGASGNEGNTGSSNLFATIRLNTDSTLPITVAYETADDTATTAGGDYGRVSGTVTFQPGQTVTLIPIPIYGDAVVEPTERFFMRITQATNATIGVASADMVIQNDD